MAGLYQKSLKEFWIIGTVYCLISFGADFISPLIGIWILVLIPLKLLLFSWLFVVAAKIVARKSKSWKMSLGEVVGICLISCLMMIPIVGIVIFFLAPLFLTLIAHKVDTAKVMYLPFVKVFLTSWVNFLPWFYSVLFMVGCYCLSFQLRGLMSIPLFAVAPIISHLYVKYTMND
jgi:hypothetical protein